MLKIIHIILICTTYCPERGPPFRPSPLCRNTPNRVLLLQSWRVVRIPSLTSSPSHPNLRKFWFLPVQDRSGEEKGTESRGGVGKRSQGGWRGFLGCLSSLEERETVKMLRVSPTVTTPARTPVFKEPTFRVFPVFCTYLPAWF